MIRKYQTFSLLNRYIVVLTVLVAVIFSWHYAFLHYCAASGFTKDIFREAFSANLPPAYGIDKFEPFNLNWFVILLTVYIVIIFSQQYTQSIFFTIILLLFFITLFGQTETGRLSEKIAHFATYFEDFYRFASVRSLLRSYTTLQSSLSVHGAHYPPGNLLLLKLSGALVTYRLILCFLLIIALYFAYILFEKRTFIFYLLFFPAFLIYPTIDFVAIPLFFFLFILLLLKYNKTYLYFIVGILLYGWSFFSFISFVGVCFIIVFQLYSFRIFFSLKTGVRYLLLLAGVLTIHFFIQIIFGFDIVLCFTNALQNNVALNSNPFDSVTRYLFRSTGNFLNFMLGGGLLMVFIFIKSKNHLINQFRVTLLITLLLLSFSGLFFMETDRVWYFFYPILALIAADFLAEISLLGRQILLVFSAIYTILFEIGLQMYS